MGIWGVGCFARDDRGSRVTDQQSDARSSLRTGGISKFASDHPKRVKLDAPIGLLGNVVPFGPVYIFGMVLPNRERRFGDGAATNGVLSTVCVGTDRPPILNAAGGHSLDARDFENDTVFQYKSS